MSVCIECGREDISPNKKVCTDCKNDIGRALEQYTSGKEHSNSSVDSVSDGLAKASISNNNNNVSSDECGLCGWGQTSQMCTSCEQKLISHEEKMPCNGGDCEESNVDLISKFDSIEKSMDEMLFQDPPPKEDCPICLLPMPYYSGLCGVSKVYMPCCGKTLCEGCSTAEDNEIENGNLKPLCSFCRVPLPPIYHANKEYLKRLKKRVKLNDAEAFYVLGCSYRDGDMGLSQDFNKAFELLNQSAELGSVSAHHSLALAYLCGENTSGHYLGLSQDVEKSTHHTLLAAIGGHEAARHVLGCTEKQLNNDVDQAVKHWIISARSGYDESLKKIGEGYKAGHVTKDEYASTLRSSVCGWDEKYRKDKSCRGLMYKRSF